MVIIPHAGKIYGSIRRCCGGQDVAPSLSPLRRGVGKPQLDPDAIDRESAEELLGEPPRGLTMLVAVHTIVD